MAWPLEAVFTGDDSRQLFYTPPNKRSVSFVIPLMALSMTPIKRNPYSERLLTDAPDDQERETPGPSRWCTCYKHKTRLTLLLSPFWKVEATSGARMEGPPSTFFSRLVLCRIKQ